MGFRNGTNLPWRKLSAHQLDTPSVAVAFGNSHVSSDVSTLWRLRGNPPVSQADHVKLALGVALSFFQ